MSRHIVIGPALALVSDPFRHALESTGGAQMPYEVKPLACDPTAINGMSERLIVSHYENNYGRRGSAAQRNHERAGRTRFYKRADFRDQRPQARGADRDEFDDPARNLFRLARRGRRTRGRLARRADL